MNAYFFPATDQYDAMGEQRSPADIVVVVVIVVGSAIDLLFSVMLLHGVIKVISGFFPTHKPLLFFLRFKILLSFPY